MNNIKTIRESLGMSKAELAEKAGVYPSMIYDLERNLDDAAERATWEKIAAALNTTVAALVNLDTIRTAQAAFDYKRERIRAALDTANDTQVNFLYAFLCK